MNDLQLSLSSILAMAESNINVGLTPALDVICKQAVMVCLCLNCGLLLLGLLHKDCSTARASRGNKLLVYQIKHTELTRHTSTHINLVRRSPHLHHPRSRPTDRSGLFCTIHC